MKSNKTDKNSRLKKLADRIGVPVYPANKQSKNRRWRRASLLAYALVLYVGYTYLGGDSGLIQYWRLHQKHDRLDKEIMLLQTRQDSLRQVITLLESDTTFIEKVARERYFLGKPGETIYTVVNQPKSAASGK